MADPFRPPEVDGDVSAITSDARACAVNIAAGRPAVTREGSPQALHPLLADGSMNRRKVLRNTGKLLVSSAAIVVGRRRADAHSSAELSIEIPDTSNWPEHVSDDFFYYKTKYSPGCMVEERREPGVESDIYWMPYEIRGVKPSVTIYKTRGLPETMTAAEFAEKLERIYRDEQLAIDSTDELAEGEVVAVPGHGEGWYIRAAFPSRTINGQLIEAWS
jgi:hypothetical protein